MSELRGDEIHIDEDEASGGSKEGVVRWILLLSLLGAIVLLSIVWITGALSQGDVEEERTMSGTIESRTENRDDIDGLVIDDADEIEAGGEQNVQDGLEVIEN